jgi:hypothetical protein
MDMKLQLTNIINGTRKRISSINDLIDWLKISGINFRTHIIDGHINLIIPCDFAKNGRIWISKNPFRGLGVNSDVADQLLKMIGK